MQETEAMMIDVAPVEQGVMAARRRRSISSLMDESFSM
jgi:hypothetical protein